MVKKIISVITCSVLLILFSTSAFCAEVEDSSIDQIGVVSDFCINDIRYIEERTEDGKFVLTSYLNGNIFDRVSVQMGEDQILYEKFLVSDNQKNKNISSVEIEKTEMYRISDIVDSNISTGITPRAGYTIKSGNIGSVNYNAVGSNGTIRRTLSFTSFCRKKTANDVFTVDADKDVAWSVLLAAVAGGFTYKITTSLAKSILVNAGIEFVGSKIPYSFKITVSGTAYFYDVTGKASDGRTSKHTGETYYGTVKKNGTTTFNGTVYAGYYPEFITRRDRSVAVWFYQDFWNDTFQVAW